MSRSVLVTGASGFIGSALVAALLARGDQVTALSRNTKHAATKLGASVAIVGSLSDIADDATIDAIVNLAGEPLAGGPWTAARRQRFFDSRVGTTAQLGKLIARLRRKPAVMVSGSAVGYYGDRGDEELDETSGPEAGLMSELCQHWEQAALSAVRDHGVRLCLLRTGLVLGKSGGLLAPLKLSTLFGLGAVLGDGRQYNPWIHLDDEVGLILHLLDREDLSGAFNASAPTPVRQREFADTLAAVCRRPRLLRVPAPFLRALGEMSDLFLVSERAVPAAALASGYRFGYTQLDAALARLIAR